MGALREDYLPHYTYDEYKLWEGEWELIDGIPYAMAPAPLIAHQQISQRIARYLDEALEACETCRALLPVDWKVSDDTVVQPDNLVICHTPLQEAYLTKAPDLIFEILSKSTAHKDTGLKFALYEREGVGYYVIVDPSEKVAKVYRLNDEGRYVKVCDTRDEAVEFTLKACRFSFDFSKIWN
jgi:Uma2 family endonuclease